MPGNVQFDAQALVSQGNEEMERIEDTLQDKYELPPDFFTGKMATNQYFNKFKNKAEQRLVEDLVVESIKIHGVDWSTFHVSVNVDEIFGEDRLPKFENGRELEMYVDSYDGFEGEGEVMSQFGLEIKDEITLTLSKKDLAKPLQTKIILILERAT